ncbi:MAG: S-adenosylmethionine decarboxylase [Pseudomonadota bacterium]
MKDLAPDILRQRLLIEGLYERSVDADCVRRYLHDVASHLDLKTYGDAIVHSPDGIGKDENDGFDGFIPLIDSGISLYVWSGSRFFSAVLFTCKTFDEGKAVDFTRIFFNTNEIEHSSF